MANLLGIAQSGIAAASAGLATTGHNIANQATPGYNLQQIVQASVEGQNLGSGFIGAGTSVQTVQRVYNTYLAAQALSVQSTQSQLNTYYNQVNSINNMIADPTTGVTPQLQNFFSAIQSLASNPGDAPSRQAVLSNGQSLATTFQTLAGQLSSLNDSVNMQISASVTNINTYAQQIAQLNNAITQAQGNAGGQPPNDLLDQRDQLVTELSQETQVTIVKQNGNYNVFAGNGQPLVIGDTASTLTTVNSSSNPSQLQVGYVSNGTTVTIPDNTLVGGNLGGLFAFRTNTLVPTENSLGSIAIGLAGTFNAQQNLGQDETGALGSDFFTEAQPNIIGNSNNTGNAVVSASISDPAVLTNSDYRVGFDGTNYTVTRLSDNKSMYSGTTFPSAAIDGVTFSNPSGSMGAGDSFLVQPTINGAAQFSVAIQNVNQIAAAVPIITGAATTNTGTGAISSGTIDSTFTAATVATPVTLTYDSTTGTLSGFPATLPVKVTNNGVTTTFAAGTPVTYTNGATISFGGANFTISGTPANGDTFTVNGNPNGSGDNRNIVALGALQSAKTLQGGTASYNSAYAQLVSQVGSTTSEMQTNSTAQSTLLTSIQNAQQSESGVNLDEEATNLIQYQQAYQASAKVMQAASDMFNVLIGVTGAT